MLLIINMNYKADLSFCFFQGQHRKTTSHTHIHTYRVLNSSILQMHVFERMLENTGTGTTCKSPWPSEESSLQLSVLTNALNIMIISISPDDKIILCLSQHRKLPSLQNALKVQILKNANNVIFTSNNILCQLRCRLLQSDLLCECSLRPSILHLSQQPY